MNATAKRLRKDEMFDRDVPLYALRHAAADEIDRLEAEIERLRGVVEALKALGWKPQRKGQDGGAIDWPCRFPD